MLLSPVFFLLWPVDDVDDDEDENENDDDGGGSKGDEDDTRIYSHGVFIKYGRFPRCHTFSSFDSFKFLVLHAAWTWCLCLQTVLTFRLLAVTGDASAGEATSVDTIQLLLVCVLLSATASVTEVATRHVFASVYMSRALSPQLRVHRRSRRSVGRSCCTHRLPFVWSWAASILCTLLCIIVTTFLSISPRLSVGPTNMVRVELDKCATEAEAARGSAWLLLLFAWLQQLSLLRDAVFQQLFSILYSFRVAVSFSLCPMLLLICPDGCQRDKELRCVVCALLGLCVLVSYF